MNKYIIASCLLLFSCNEYNRKTSKNEITNIDSLEEFVDIKQDCIDFISPKKIGKLNNSIRIDLNNLEDINLVKWSDSSVIEFHKKNTILQNYNMGGYYPAIQTEIYSFAEIPSLSLKMNNSIIYIEINHHYQACYLYMCNGKQNYTLLLSEIKEGMIYVYSEIDEDGKIIRYSENYFLDKDEETVSTTFLEEGIIIERDEIKFIQLNTEFNEIEVDSMKRQKYINFDNYVVHPALKDVNNGNVPNGTFDKK